MKRVIFVPVKKLIYYGRNIDHQISTQIFELAFQKRDQTILPALGSTTFKISKNA